MRGKVDFSNQSQNDWQGDGGGVDAIDLWPLSHHRGGMKNIFAWYIPETQWHHCWKSNRSKHVLISLTVITANLVIPGVILMTFAAAVLPCTSVVLCLKRSYHFRPSASALVTSSSNISDVPVSSGCYSTSSFSWETCSPVLLSCSMFSAPFSPKM